MSERGNQNHKRIVEEEMRRARVVGHAPPTVTRATPDPLPSVRRLLGRVRTHPWQSVAILMMTAGPVAVAFGTGLPGLLVPLLLLAFAIGGAIMFVQRAKDKIRGVAWVLIAAGSLIAVLTPFYVRGEYQLRVEAWRRSGLIWRVPEPASPWPGFVVAGLLVAFGILLLAIRRPEH